MVQSHLDHCLCRDRGVCLHSGLHVEIWIYSQDAFNIVIGSKYVKRADGNVCALESQSGPSLYAGNNPALELLLSEVRERFAKSKALQRSNQ